MQLTKRTGAETSLNCSQHMQSLLENSKTMHKDKLIEPHQMKTRLLTRTQQYIHIFIHIYIQFSDRALKKELVTEKQMASLETNKTENTIKMSISIFQLYGSMFITFFLKNKASKLILDTNMYLLYFLFIGRYNISKALIEFRK